MKLSELVLSSSNFKLITEAGETLSNRDLLDAAKDKAKTFQGGSFISEYPKNCSSLLIGLLSASLLGVGYVMLPRAEFDVSDTKVNLKDSGLKAHTNIDMIGIPTSGSTGTPKIIVKSLHDLLRAISRKPMQDLVLAMTFDFRLFAGLQVLLQALVAGATFVESPKPIGRALNHWQKFGVNHISSTNSRMRQIVSEATFLSMDLKSVTLGGEAATEDVLSKIRVQNPGIKVRHIFASTESGVLFSVSDGEAGFKKIHLNEQFCKVESGELFYRDKAGKWLSTGDLLVEKNGRYQFAGRSNDIVVVAGSNVNLKLIEGAILEGSMFNDVRVYAKKSPFSGNLVVCDYVSETEFSTDEIKDLMRGLREVYGRESVPQLFNRVEKITLSSAGKKLTS